MKFKNLTKKLAAGLLAVSMLFVGTNTPVSAADVKSDTYSVYYNSSASNNMTDYPRITYYGGTNYFQVSAISGAAYTITVYFTPTNAKIEQGTLSATRACTQTFTYPDNQSAPSVVQFKVTLSNSPSTYTASSSGKVYFN